MKVRCYESSDEDAVIALWKDCGPTRDWNDPHQDISRKLTTQPEWFLVGIDDGALVASAMFGYDGHRGWVNYLAVSPSSQRRGHARRLMERGEALLTAAGCPKLNLQIRNGNKDVIAFYKRLGYGQDDVTSLGKRLISDVASGP